jgi:hypothetical protein
MRNATFAAILAVAAVAPLAHASPVPVVLAVDTSRSIGRSELSAAIESLRAMVRQLPSDTPVGVIEFGDATRWLLRPDASRERALRALDGLEPTGSITLLNDALFETARSLAAGGVIVLASDGRDENSATTADDVARLCNANGVRIVTLGVGRRVDERAMRRLALLTDGGFVGPQPFAAGTDLLIAVEGSRRGVAERLAKAAPPTPAPPRRAAVPAPAPTPVPDEAGVSVPEWVPVALALAAVLAIAALILWRRQRREEQRVCERCGMPLELWDSECPHCRAAMDRDASQVSEREDRERLAEAVAVAAPVGEEIEPALLTRALLEEPIDKTFILGEQVILVVKEHRKPPRLFTLAPDAPFTVGRATKVNSLTLADPTMSAQHFRIVYKEGAYFVADLETTNGTLVNGERIRVHKLRGGDQIHAGEVDFEFRVQYQKRI